MRKAYKKIEINLRSEEKKKKHVNRCVFVRGLMMCFLLGRKSRNGQRNKHDKSMLDRKQNDINNEEEANKRKTK